MRPRRPTTILLALVLIIVAGCTKPANTSPRPTPAPAPTESAAAAGGKWCRWTTQALPGGPAIKTGTPPLAAPNTGHATMTIKTNRGTIVADVDLSRTPCTAAALRYRGSSGYFRSAWIRSSVRRRAQLPNPAHRRTDASKAHRHRVRAPSGTTAATCREVANEDTVRRPDKKPVTYARGVLAMANSGPDTNGSQFFIVYKDSQLLPDFTRLGIVTQGLDVVDTVAAGGVQPTNGKPRADVAPKTKLVIESLTVTG